MAKPTKTIQVEAEIHTPIASATDQDSLDEEEAPLPDLKSPTVSLVGLAPSTSTPKLTGGKPRCLPEIEEIDPSEDSTIADTPKTSRGKYESLPSSREQPTSKRRRRCETYVFSDEQESELSEWYQLHPIFYDKTEQHYKNAASRRKECVWTPHVPVSTIHSFNHVFYLCYWPNMYVNKHVYYDSNACTH